jgi:hypothetical protein
MSTDISSLPQDVVTWLELFGEVAQPQTVNIQEFMKDDNLAAFRARYDKLALRRDDILLYPEAYCSDDLKDIRRKIDEEDKKVAAIGDPKDAEEAEKAVAAVDALEKEIEKGAPKFRAHDKEVRKYFAELKKLRPKIQLADSLPASGSGGDSPWKSERLAYDAQRLSLITEQNKKEFKKANQEIPKLIVAIDNLVKKKLEQVKTQVDDATGTDGSAVKSKKLVDEMYSTPGLLSSMGPEMQLKLLETLRTKTVSCKACGKGMSKKEFEANGNKCISNLATPCPADQIETAKKCKKCGTPSSGTNCQKVCDHDQKNKWHNCVCGENFKYNGSKPTCSKCGKKGSSNITFEGNFCGSCGKQWGGGKKCTAKCNSTEKKIDEVLSKNRNRDLLDARAKVLGKMTMDEKFVELDKENRKEIAKQLREFDEFNQAEEKWAEWVKDGDLTKIQTVLEKIVEKQCKILGHDQYPGHSGPTITLVLTDPTSDKNMSASAYGYCEPGFPTSIKLNKAHSGFNDFKEVVDTIIHENSHAWQEMIMKKLKGESPYTEADKKSIEENDDLKVQAKMFLENDQTYIQSKISDEAYRHEPLEEHAWNAGGATSAMLLVPPAVQSMKSSELMKSKTFFLKSIKREANAKMVTKERHGIYSSEWEGQEPEDKVLTFEYLDRSSGTVQKQNISIISVDNEVTITTDFDASNLTTPLIDPAKIQSELKSMALRVFTKEMSTLNPTELDQLHNTLVSEKNYQKVDTGSGVEFRQPLTYEFAELTGSRLLLDETVTELV